MKEQVSRLLATGPVVTDGAWGTELQARGLSPGDFPDAWNLTQPEKVLEVARAYVDAGSRVILTNTFGANRLRLGAHGLADKVREINLEGVRLSRQAAEGRAVVFASLGPTGRMLLTGEVTQEELDTAFAEQAQALAEGGADAIVVETMSDLGEALPALAAARATGLPVAVCMVFDSGKNKDRTMMGATPEEVATALAEAGADVIGANCGQGIAGYVPVCQRMRKVTDKPLWMKPNAGMPAMVEGRIVYQITAGEFAAYVPVLVKAGANFVGGCCGSNPDFVRAIKARLSA